MKIFWHICLINHWMEIFLSQLRTMIDSGLYDNAKEIFLSALGDQKELNNLRRVSMEFPKLQLVKHNTDISEYEFPTLQLLYDSCKGDLFYGLYLHGKGVSYPYEKNQQGYVGGTKWRNYMDYYCITKWMDCVTELNKGYELCGVKLLSPRHSPSNKLHYSGNYYWFRSEYIKTLSPPNGLNKKDRFEAEMWSCSNTPIAATLCQDFIDYNSKGVFVPPKI